MERVKASRAVVERALEGDAMIYGLNTGLGSRRDRRVSREDLARYQVQMVRDHAGGVGPPLPDEDVRALMAARIAGIARGGSGAHPGALDTLVGMLNGGVHPVVPEVGSVGASDLMHMAAIAMVVIGRGDARLDGRTMPGGEALTRAGIAPHQLHPKDGLALISGNGVSIGLGALAALDAERTVILADVAGALTLEAIAGNPGPSTRRPREPSRCPARSPRPRTSANCWPAASSPTRAAGRPSSVSSPPARGFPEVTAAAAARAAALPRAASSSNGPGLPPVAPQKGATTCASPIASASSRARAPPADRRAVGAHQRDPIPSGAPSCARCPRCLQRLAAAHRAPVKAPLPRDLSRPARSARPCA